MTQLLLTEVSIIGALAAQYCWFDCCSLYSLSGQTWLRSIPAAQVRLDVTEASVQDCMLVWQLPSTHANPLVVCRALHKHLPAPWTPCPTGVMQRVVRSPVFPPEAAQSLCFHPLPESQPVLPCLLRRLLQKGRYEDALELAR